MNFTRDPVIETVITPKEGCKLVVRSSKGNSGEDYFVDAVEVVSFGNFLFFRSLERPKSFLLPVSDYEILELKETRMVLKTASSDKSIKISTSKKEDNAEEHDKPTDKRKRRYRKRKISADHKKKIEKEIKKIDVVENLPTLTDAKTSPEEVKSSFTRLFPPPSKLIKENLTKSKEVELSQEDIFASDMGNAKIETKNNDDVLSEAVSKSSNDQENEKKSNNEDDV